MSCFSKDEWDSVGKLGERVIQQGESASEGAQICGLPPGFQEQQVVLSGFMRGSYGAAGLAGHKINTELHLGTLGYN